MTQRIVISVDQLCRPQPGGIGSYVRGLVDGLASAGEGVEIIGVGPHSRSAAVRQLGVEVRTTLLGLRGLTTLWPRYPFGVPGDADVVHATSIAGPFGGGRARAVHSVTMHDLLWRDEPESSTPNGIRFHESRLQLLLRRENLRIITTSPRLGVRLFQIGIDPDRIRFARLGWTTVPPTRRSRRASARSSPNTASAGPSPSTRERASPARTWSAWSAPSAPRGPRTPPSVRW